MIMTISAKLDLFWFGASNEKKAILLLITSKKKKKILNDNT
jgi:hypothetical protein